MTARSLIGRIVQQEDVNFLLTNRIPRRWLTQFMGWLSRIESPWLCAACISLWRVFSDLDLSEAKQTRFKSLHDCFTRELKDGVRPIDTDPAVLSSPCDALVGACGQVQDGSVLQAKGFPYPLIDLLGDAELVRYYRDGQFATLRLTSSMYHRFHAPYDCRVEQVNYISGDTWNVNPIALRRVERLFCKNERAVIRCRLALGCAAHAGARRGHPGREHSSEISRRAAAPALSGPEPVIACDARLRKGEEMGWFEHGSTIIVFAPQGISLCGQLREGERIRMGQALMRIESAV